MTYTGRMRLHFNRHGAAPLVWCVATDDWEMAVSHILVTAPMRTVYAPKPVADDEDGKPSAWLEVCGTLHVAGGVARIEP